ncbi:MAG: lytic transglycosylase domain-containing protein [Methylocystis sp.]|uniref:lytic transglycosylase domain-containing protein n=1 Tax=Methylocystis sp. TaxID=1911079 RepID=UPI003DA53151
MLVSVTALATISHSQARASEIAKCARDSIQASAEFVASATDEASRRFHIPPQWIRAVMRTESYGDACAVSGKGAIGLMQIMPATYEELRLKHALGPDPFDPGDNILAGAAYLSEMFERYREGGFLAAYNAGPQRYEQYLHGRPLPIETINYVAGLASKLGLEELAATQSSPSADISKPSTFVALTKLNSARQIAQNSATSAGATTGESVPHPLFPAQRDDNIFARISLSNDDAIADLSPVHRSAAEIFVARRAR